MSVVNIRDFSDVDGQALNNVALAAFFQFRNQYSDWPAMADGVSRMSQLASIGEIIVAEHEGHIVGGVAYVPGGRPKAAYFDQSWPIIRMLVVAPDARSKGIGRRLTEECVLRARRDKAPLIALHTTKIMSVAQPMYVRMGFELIRDAPPIYGVPYAVYTKTL
jgi:ribosomal protein S18 acetylase RimI-like enzyme